MTNTSHIKKLVFTSQSQQSGGVRRLVAISGPEAVSTDYVANIMEREMARLREEVSPMGNILKNSGLHFKGTVSDH